MCGNDYTFNEETAFYLTEKLVVCGECGDYIEMLLNSDDPEKIRSAYQYIRKCAEKTENTGVFACLKEILENNANVVKESELAAYNTARVEYTGTQTSEMFDMDNPGTFSNASGDDLPYVVLQVTLKEKFFGTGSGNLSELEEVINFYAFKGYRLHTMSTSAGGSKGILGGDRIQATLVFEKKNM